MKTLKNPIVSNAASALQIAIRTGNEKQINQKIKIFLEAVSDTIKQDYKAANGNKSILLRIYYREGNDTDAYQHIGVGSYNRTWNSVTERVALRL